METQATTISTGGRLRMWGGSLLVAAVLGALGVFVVSLVEDAHANGLRAHLRTILAADTEALRIWRRGQMRVTAAVAGDIGWRRRMIDILDAGPELMTPAALAGAKAHRELREGLDVICGELGHEAFSVMDTTGRIVSASDESTLGTLAGGTFGESVRRALAGVDHFSIPFRAGADGSGSPVMTVSVPIHDESAVVRGVLTFWMRPERDFSRILQVARPGASGESYAFDRDGLMLSGSRFEQELRTIGLLADDGDSEHGAVLRIHIRDPGGNMLEGFRPGQDRRALPLTRMAASAVAGHDGVDVEGYADYRGVPVVGAWTWMPDAGLGVATEMDAGEALRSVVILRTAFGVLWGLLVAAGAGIALYAFFVGRLRRRIEKAERRAERLGQYTLVRRIGSGGMGDVYLAKHALLRRPTAVKILQPDRTDEHSLIRFEREVQQSSRLTHPNTIAIYDYGHTPDGTFYYAMEYLDGIALDRLVKTEGPIPQGRLIFILRQVCASLVEAHGLGLIHRDIKPGNLMLCRRGGFFDVVKVLDFGLVKDLTGGDTVELSMTGAITGTPLYLSPESIRDARSVDVRSDIYSVGAVAYYLLTGEHVFRGETTLDLVMHHVKSAPRRPSERFGRPFSRDLEDVILRCLAKAPDDRYATASELRAAFAACAAADSWGHDEAQRWWEENTERLRVTYQLSLPSTPGTPLSVPELEVDLDGRLSTDG